MRVRLLASLVLGACLALSASSAFAQSGGGSLRGYIKDESGAVLPGVTVTATSTELLRPVGQRHRRNRPVSPERAAARHVCALRGADGLRDHRRENILVRAGATFTIDIQMGLEHAAGNDHGRRASRR